VSVNTKDFRFDRLLSYALRCCHHVFGLPGFYRVLLWTHAWCREIGTGHAPSFLFNIALEAILGDTGFDFGHASLFHAGRSVCGVHIGQTSEDDLQSHGKIRIR